MGRTKGYQMLSTPGSPRAYRLDTLAAWEERELAGCAGRATAEPAAAITTDPASTGTTTATTPTAAHGVLSSASVRRP